MIASIIASRNNKKVLLLDKLSSLGVKLKATGGGKCNLTNRLPQDKFIDNFGKNGKFIRDALSQFTSNDLIEFLSNIGVIVHCFHLSTPNLSVNIFTKLTASLVLKSSSTSSHSNHHKKCRDCSYGKFLGSSYRRLGQPQPDNP